VSWDLSITDNVLGASSGSNEVIEEDLLELNEDEDLNVINPAESVLTQLVVTPWDMHQDGDKDSEMRVNHDAIFLDKRHWDPKVVE